MSCRDMSSDQKMVVDNLPLDFFEEQKAGNGDVVLEYNFAKKSHIVVCTLKYGSYEGRGYGKNEHDAKRFAAVNVIRNLPSDLFVSYISYRNKMLNVADLNDKVMPELATAELAVAKDSDEEEERLADRMDSTFTVAAIAGLRSDSLASELSLGTLNHEAAHSLNTETTGVVLDCEQANEKIEELPVVWYRKLLNYMKFDCLRKNAAE